MDIKIGNVAAGSGCRAFIVAELSANHCGKFDVAADTVKAAKECGADAIKLQTYTPDTITIDCDNEYFKIKQGTVWDGRTLYELYREAYMPWEWQPRLKRLAESLGLLCFSSPFDRGAVDFLKDMDVPAYKIASFEITDIPLIEYAASKGKPVILATGVAESADIEEAVNACRRVGNNQIAVLKCTSAYPAPFDEANLRTVPDIAARFNVVAGVSDHTPGIAVPVAAVTLGASIIEKHFILDRKLGGPDAGFSLEPAEFKAMSLAVRQAEAALGRISYELCGKAKRSREFSRSLFAVSDIKAGEKFTERNVRSIRPGYGLHPKHLPRLLGRSAKTNILKGTPLTWEIVGD